MKHQLTVVWQHIRRSPYQAASAVMIMTLTIFVGLSFVLLSLASGQLLGYLEKKPQVIAFFTDKITSEEQVSNLEKQLTDTGKVASLKFISKDQALAIYQERNKNDQLLLELVTANILPASLEVSGKTVSDLPGLFSILKKADNVEEISYQKDIVDNLIGVLDKFRRFGLGLVIFLLVTSLFTIVTIVGMKISLRKDEIEVQRLVGASKWYIRFPFLFEGFIYGAFGAVISWTVIYAVIYFSTPAVLPYISGLSILPVSPLFMVELLGITCLTGGLVGVVGSYFAVWRYLKD